MSYATSNGECRVLVLDFDGTVCIGDGPVWAYADAVLEHIADDRLAHDIRGHLADFLSGDPHSPRYKDGYSAVAALTSAAVTADVRSAAYRESRSGLATGTTTGVSAPDGLHAFLAGLGDSTYRVLATNAPLDGVKETISSLGLNDVIDRIHPESNKPGGFTGLLSHLADGRDPTMLMSVGDVYENDIAPALDFGCATAYIDRWDQHTGPAHLRARRFADLYPGISDWARDPATFRSTHPIRTLDQGNPS